MQGHTVLLFRAGVHLESILHPYSLQDLDELAHIKGLCHVRKKPSAASLGYLLPQLWRWLHGPPLTCKIAGKICKSGFQRLDVIITVVRRREAVKNVSRSD